MSPAFSFDIGDASFLPSAESPGFVDAGGSGFGGGLLSIQDVGIQQYTVEQNVVRRG